MPSKPEKIPEVRKRFYEKHRKKVIANVTARKRNEYGGTCRFCGADTIGQSKAKPGSDFCGKPECRSKAYKERAAEFSEHGKRNGVAFNPKTGTFEPVYRK